MWGTCTVNTVMQLSIWSKGDNEHIQFSVGCQLQAQVDQHPDWHGSHCVVRSAW
jgi:hypothetical protein